MKFKTILIFAFALTLMLGVNFVFAKAQPNGTPFSAIWEKLGELEDRIEALEEGPSCTPVAEECDGLDNDCDGNVDEELTTSCYSGDPATEGVGICHSGEQICTSGSWDDCVDEQLPLIEECNGLDDDCDGQTDEELTTSCYSGDPSTEGVGICHSGEQVCSSGSWGTCINQQLPLAEVCNGLDDNCDGETDEGDPGAGQSCDTGLQGICQAGTTTCQAGSLDCVQNNQSIDEICDNSLDDDCDGVVDNCP